MSDLMKLAKGKSITAGGVVTNYIEVGSGSPVLFLHGSGVGVSAYANWNGTLPEIGRHFRAIALDVAGFGYSEPPADSPYGLPYWVNHVVAFLDELKLDRVDIVGNSFGGAVALALTVRRPDRVMRVVLMGSVGVEFEVPAAFGSGWAGELTTARMRSILENFTSDPLRITDEMIELRLQTASRSEYKARQARLFPGAREERVKALITPESEIAAINKHVMLIHGRDDKIVPVETSWRLHGLIRRSDLHVFGDCGHWSHIDRAREFNEIILKFFALENRLGESA